jgi:hypothetical protein
MHFILRKIFYFISDATLSSGGTYVCETFKE